MSEENGWQMLRESLPKGTQRYVYSPSDFDEDEFNPTIFVEVPIIYVKSVGFESGLYRVICTNGMMDTITSNGFRLKPQEFTQETFEPLIQGILGGLKDSTDSYMEFLNYLHNCPSDPMDARITLERFGKAIPKKLHTEMKRFVDLVEQGKPLTEDILPEFITTKMDIVNAMTRLAQKMPDLPRQLKAESAVFKHFYNLYQEETKSSISFRNLKDVYQDLGGDISQEITESLAVDNSEFVSAN